MRDQQAESYFGEWIHREAAAERIVPVVGKLYREHGVVVTIFGRSLVRSSPIDILKAHRFARHFLDRELPVELSSEMLEALGKLQPAASRVDIGKLALRYQNEPAGKDLEAFLRAELGSLDAGRQLLQAEPRDVVLYGFGRIGRMLARILIDRSGGGDKWRLRAVVVQRPTKGDLEKRASLLRRDSIHGSFKGTVQLDRDENALVANGNLIRILYAESPEKADYASYGIENAIVVDNSGVWRDRDGLGMHLRARGVDKVILTAPGKGDIPNIIYGVNSGDICPEERLLSAGSCTTNAIVPVLKVMADRFGIERGHIDTIHSYTNDQNLVDNFHSKTRRGRGAPLNMVITETGAAGAVAKALPELKGKVTANAIRVPTPNVSLAILNLGLGRSTTVDEVNQHLRGISLDSPLQGQLDYITSPEVVSSDFIGSLKTAIVDSTSTIVTGSQCVLYVWYDNEYGYAGQVVRIVQHLSGLELPSYPQ